MIPGDRLARSISETAISSRANVCRYLSPSLGQSYTELTQRSAYIISALTFMLHPLPIAFIGNSYYSDRLPLLN